MLLSRQENVLICGFANGHVKMFSMPSLEQIHDLDVSKNGAVNCLSFTPDWQFLIIGSSDGTINVCFDPEGYYAKLAERLRTDKLI
jgi:WD40 repeat protein